MRLVTRQQAAVSPPQPRSLGREEARRQPRQRPLLTSCSWALCRARPPARHLQSLSQVATDQSVWTS